MEKVKKEVDVLYRKYANLQLQRAKKEPPIVNDWASNWISNITENEFYFKNSEGKKYVHHILQHKMMGDLQIHTDMPLLITSTYTKENKQRLSFVLEDCEYVYGMSFVAGENGTFIHGKGVYNSNGLIAYTLPNEALSKIEPLENQIKFAISNLPAYRLYQATGMLTFEEIS